MIEITSLHKSFSDKVLFKDFNIYIEGGEFIIFTGESGCGKTTLLNMIGAIESIDKGSIVVNGIDVSQVRNRMKLFGEMYGFVFQNFALVEGKTVEENLSLVQPKYQSGVSMRDALEYVSLSGFEKKPVYKLSGGEQQRVALARLLMKKCSVILADEPTGSLDKKNADEVMRILSILNSHGKTIIMVTHSDEVAKQADRVINLH
jgi:putative ABC transport system ATP-binding protein